MADGTAARDGAREAIVRLARDAAHRAGRLLIERWGAAPSGVRAKCSPTDLVSEADHEAERLLPAVGHVRCLGSAALDLAWLAEGRIDAVYHERSLKDWDSAAGALIAREAGMEVAVLAPMAPGLSRRLPAAPPPLFASLLALAGGRS